MKTCVVRWHISGQAEISGWDEAVSNRIIGLQEACAENICRVKPGPFQLQMADIMRSDGERQTWDTRRPSPLDRQMGTG